LNKAAVVIAEANIQSTWTHEIMLAFLLCSDRCIE